MKIELVVGTWMMKAIMFGDASSLVQGPSKNCSRDLMERLEIASRVLADPPSVSLPFKVSLIQMK